LSVRRGPPHRALGVSELRGVVVHGCQARRRLFTPHAGESADHPGLSPIPQRPLSLLT
jgi:hypothetical protein